MQDKYRIMLIITTVALLVMAGLYGVKIQSSRQPRIVLKQPQWSQLGGSAQRTCIGKGCGAKGKVAWTFQTGNAVEGSAAIGGDGTVFIWSYDGNLYAIDGQAGKVKWKNSTRNYSLVTKVLGKQPYNPRGVAYFAPTPALTGDGTVVITSHDGCVYALNEANGKIKWTHNVNQLMESSPSIDKNGIIYVTARVGWVYAIDSANGKRLWEFREPYRGMIQYSPTAGANGLVYVGTNSGEVCALDCGTGKLTWQTSVKGGAGTPMVGSDGTVYIGDGGGDITALDGKTGVKKWDTCYSGGLPYLALGADGTVYAVNTNKSNARLYALDPRTGAERWRFDIHKVTGVPQLCVASDGTVYINGRYTPKRAGVFVGSKGVVHQPSSSPARALCALDGRTGKMKWSVEIDNAQFAAPVVGADGTVYIGSWNGRISAIR